MTQQFNPNYFIQHSALSVKLNGNSYVTTNASEYVAVSCVSGTKIAINNVISLRGSNNVISPDFAASLSYRQWTIAGYNTKFDDDYKEKRMYVYARLDNSTNGSSGLIIFSPNNYDYNGDIITDDVTAEEISAYESNIASDAHASTYQTLTKTNDDGTTTTYRIYKTADGKYHRCTDNSSSYYYMQLGVISAPSSGKRSWENNLSGFPDLDLGQLDTPLNEKKDDLFSKYNGKIYQNFPFGELDLEGNFIWNDTTLYGPFGENDNIKTYLNMKSDALPTVKAVAKNFVAKYKNDSNDDHRLELGQLVVAGREVTLDTVYYNPATDYAVVDNVAYLKWTLGEYVASDLMEIDGKTYDITTLKRTVVETEVPEGEEAPEPTYTYEVIETSKERSIGDYKVITSATWPCTATDIVEVDGKYYIEKSIYRNPDTGAYYLPKQGAIQVDADATSYTIKSVAAPPDNEFVEIKKTNAKQDQSERMLATFGHLMPETSGAGVWRDANGFIHMDTDYLNVHNKATFKEVEVEELNYVGGSIVLTPADGFKIEIVEPITDYSNEKYNPGHASFADGEPCAFRLLWRSNDAQGQEVKNMWKVGDQALSQTFNLGKNSEENPISHGSFDGENMGTSYWWRYVLEVDNKDIEVKTDEVSVDSSLEKTVINYNYIVVSNDRETKASYKIKCEKTESNTTGYKVEQGVHQYAVSEENDIPKVNETVVMLGHQQMPGEKDTDAQQRQNAIILQSSASRPYIREYTDINCLMQLTNHHCAVQIQPGNNYFEGTVTMKSSSSENPFDTDTLISQLQELKDAYNALKARMNGLEGYGFNYIRNSGFTGDYLSTQVQEDMVIVPDWNSFSERMKHWIYPDESLLKISDDENSASGYSLNLKNTHITQNMTMKPVKGETYSFAFKAKSESGNGHITVSIGGLTEEFEINTDTYVRYEWVAFVPQEYGSVLNIEGNATICELMLNPGKTCQDWQYCMLDNADTATDYGNLHYLAEALNGYTKSEGGLILSSLIQLGNWMSSTDLDVHAGLNGLCNFKGDDLTPEETPAFWAGGKFDQAISTAQYYKNTNSQLIPDEETRANHATAMIAHDGTAIFNKAIVRGAIYADSGSFEGKVIATSGEFKGKVIATEGEFTGTINADGGYLKNMTISNALSFTSDSNYKFTPINEQGQASLAFQYTSEEKLHTAVEFGIYKGYDDYGNWKSPYLNVGDPDDHDACVQISTNSIHLSQFKGEHQGMSNVLTPERLTLSSPDGSSMIELGFDLEDLGNGSYDYAPYILLKKEKGNTKSKSADLKITLDINGAIGISGNNGDDGKFQKVEWQ